VQHTITPPDCPHWWQQGPVDRPTSAKLSVTRPRVALAGVCVVGVGTAPWSPATVTESCLLRRDGANEGEGEADGAAEGATCACSKGPFGGVGCCSAKAIFVSSSCVRVAALGDTKPRGIPLWASVCRASGARTIPLDAMLARAPGLK